MHSKTHEPDVAQLRRDKAMKLKKSLLVKALSILLLMLLAILTMVAAFDGERYWAASYFAGFLGKTIYLLSVIDREADEGGGE